MSFLLFTFNLGILFFFIFPFSLMWGLCHFSSSGLQVCWSSFHSLYKNGIFLDLSHRAITMAQFNFLPFCLCLGSKLLNICWASSSNWDVSWSNWIMKAMSMLSFHTFFYGFWIYAPWHLWSPIGIPECRVWSKISCMKSFTFDRFVGFEILLRI